MSDGDYEERLNDLERVCRSIPARFGGGPSPVYLLVMGDGNLIATYGAANYYGLKYNTGSTPTTVPTATPSTTPGALADNLSWATLYAPDGTTSTVWAGSRMQPDGAGPTYSADLQSIVPKNTTVVSFGAVQMQVLASGVYVPVYLPGRLA